MSSSWYPTPGKALPQLCLKFLPKQLHSRIVQRGVGKLCVHSSSRSLAEDLPRGHAPPRLPATIGVHGNCPQQLDLHTQAG